MAAQQFPFEIKDVPAEITAEYRKFSNGPKIDFVHVGPEKYRLSAIFRQECVNIYNMPLRADDVFVVTFPKSGTTLTQELVWLVCNNFDYDTAAKKLLLDRFPFIEASMVLSDPKAIEWTRNNMQVPLEAREDVLKALLVPVLEVLAKAPSPRFIKTHLPFSLMPPGLLDTSKVVYVARDPRDVAVSYYHHNKLFKLVNFQGEFKDFWKIFVEGGFDWCPFFPHIKEAWSKRDHPNMLFLFYEDMTKDMPAAVRRIARFLDKPASEQQVQQLCEHLHIDTFRKNKSVNAEDLKDMGISNKSENFIRKGKSGGWRAYFDEDMTQQAERWMQENLRGTDLEFPKRN